MDKLKSYIGDRDDDDTLSFLEDANDTITSMNDDYKAKYETALKDKEELDKTWRAKYKSRFFDDANINNNNTNNNNNDHIDNIFDERSEAQKQAESISIDDLFTEVK